MNAFGRESYLGLADELSVDGATLDGFDPDVVAAARRFASELGLPFPIRDVDIALELLERVERRAMTFRSDTPVLDRAGGPLRLRTIAERLVGHDWRLEVLEATGPKPVTVLLVVRDERPYDTLIEETTPASTAVRRDVVRNLEADADALRPVLEAEIRRLAGVPKGTHR